MWPTHPRLSWSPTRRLHGLIPVALRSLYVTALARPVDAAALGAALTLAAGREEATAADETPASKRKLAVLVAEDNRTNQMVISKILARVGHDVHLVDNGEAALDALNAHAFDIVLMDVNMPVMNGIEATKLYRFASLGMPRIPIVALTADATAEASARCEEAGMDACVTKPIEPARLIEIIDVPGGGRGGRHRDRAAGRGRNPHRRAPEIPSQRQRNRSRRRP